MSEIMDLLVQPCVIVSRAASGDVDEYGDAVAAETQTASVCLLQQTDSSEGAGAVETTRWTAFLPGDVVVKGADSLIVAGAEYGFDGDAAPIVDPLTGGVHHIEARVRRVA